MAKVTTATVNEAEKTLYAGLDNGMILTRRLTDQELIDFKNHPDKFFGVFQEQVKKTNGPYEFFERMVEIHMAHPRESLLKKTERFPDAKRLHELPHEEFVLAYCERLTMNNPTFKDQLVRVPPPDHS